MGFDSEKLVESEFLHSFRCDEVGHDASRRGLEFRTAGVKFWPVDRVVVQPRLCLHLLIQTSTNTVVILTSYVLFPQITFQISI